MKRKCLLPLICLLALSGCGERTAEGAMSPFPSSTRVETAPFATAASEQEEGSPLIPEKELPFSDPVVYRTLCNELGVEMLTEAALPELAALEALRIESCYTTADNDMVWGLDTLTDLPRYCPNLRRLELMIYGRSGGVTAEDWAELQMLPLESLSIYGGEGFEVVEPPEGLSHLALAAGENALPDNMIIDPAVVALQGELEQYVRLRVDGWVFELLSTNFWNEETEENFWGGWECKVLVFRETQEELRFIQSFDILGRPNADADRSLVCTDVDFDGRPDLLVLLGHFGAQGAVGYTAFLQREGEFIPCESFSDIPNPSLDPENKQVLCQMRHSAASHGWGKYQYRNGAFVRVAYLTEEPVPGSSQGNDGELIWQWTEETLQDGEMVQSRCWRSDEYTREELEDIIYNENSDWGLLTDRWRVLYNSGLMADFSIYGE